VSASQFTGKGTSLHDHQHHLQAGVGHLVWCLATDWTTGRSKFYPRQSQKDFSSSLWAQTASGTHSVSCTMDTRGSFPGGKVRPGRDAGHSPQSSAEVVNEQELYFLSPLRLHRCVVGLLFNQHHLQAETRTALPGSHRNTRTNLVHHPRYMGTDCVRS
jgi:hypothetical protein